MFILTKQTTHDCFGDKHPIVQIGYTDDREVVNEWRSKTIMGECYDYIILHELNKETIKQYIHNGRIR